MWPFRCYKVVFSGNLLNPRVLVLCVILSLASSFAISPPELLRLAFASLFPLAQQLAQPLSHSLSRLAARSAAQPLALFRSPFPSLFITHHISARLCRYLSLATLASLTCSLRSLFSPSRLLYALFSLSLGTYASLACPFVLPFLRPLLHSLSPLLVFSLLIQ